jgi:hypothetical protein
MHFNSWQVKSVGPPGRSLQCRTQRHLKPFSDFLTFAVLRPPIWRCKTDRHAVQTPGDIVATLANFSLQIVG